MNFNENKTFFIHNRSFKAFFVDKLRQNLLASSLTEWDHGLN